MHCEAFDKDIRLFREQVKRFNLVYDCRECVHLNDQTRLCSMAYPNDMIWRAAQTGSPFDDGDLVFCKYFEHA